MKVIALSIAVLLSGCAAVNEPLVFDKPGATQTDFNQAWARCDYQTSAATTATDYTYATIIGQELDRATRKRELTIKCMTAEGFTLRK